MNLCYDLVLLLKQRMELGLDTCFGTVIIRRGGGGVEGGRWGVKLFLLAVLRHIILLADDLQTCRVMKESKRNRKAVVNQVEIVGILGRVS